MAEFVQRRVEDQIPELEQLQRVGLLTAPELRSVIKKRTALEYKLRRRQVEKDDFIGYVQYEINFLELLKKRRQRIGYSFKKDEIEYVIVQRIHQLFSRATNKWKEDLQLWMSHVAFCRKWNCRYQLSKIFSSMLAVHPDKPALWIMAAKWEFEDQLSAESARHLFLRALRFHPDCPKLYQEYFRMELMNVEKQRKENEELEKAKMDVGEAGYSEDILQGALAQVVYKAALEKITGAEFHLALLSIAKKFDFTEELQTAMMADLQSRHAGDPLTWDFLARQELSAKVTPAPECASKSSKAQEVARQEERCSRVYEEALGSIHTEAMYELYLAFCWERYKRQTNNRNVKLQRQERLLGTLRRAHGDGLLPQARYNDWVALLLQLGQAEAALEASSAAVARFSSSVDVWRSRLELLLNLEGEQVEPEFEKAVAAVKPQEALPLWTLMLEWSERERTAEHTEALYQKLVLNPTISRVMKVSYLDWSYRTHGYTAARKVFRRLHESRPLCLEFFQKMMEIEKLQDGGKMENLRDCYERALREFGSTNPDLWLSYIKEELGHPGGKPESCGAIHWRAMKVLQGEDVERFVNKYTLLQTGHL
ncbi:U3 small nucleolar RNA-associated protein 6 homolog [Gastrophryne carolinensis]